MLYNIIEWNKDDIQQTADFIDDFTVGTSLINALHIDSFDTSLITTKDAITVCKMKLMGEYHGILVRQEEKLLEDAEVYLLTWDGEASDGGHMTRLDADKLREIALGTFTERLAE